MGLIFKNDRHSMISTNIVMAGNPRPSTTWIAGFFIPVVSTRLQCSDTAISYSGYGVEDGNKRVAPANTAPTSNDRRKPASAMLVEAIAAIRNGGTTNIVLEAVMPNIINANFHGTTLAIVEHNNEPYVSAKEIVEAIGLKWGAQYVKLNHNRERWGIAKIEIPSEGGKQIAIGLPLRKLPGWLMTIQPNKVPNELRAKIIHYQTECDRVLWEHWNQQTHQPPTQPQLHLPTHTPEEDIFTTVTIIQAGHPPQTKTYQGQVTVIPKPQAYELLKAIETAAKHLHFNTIEGINNLLAESMSTERTTTHF